MSHQPTDPKSTNTAQTGADGENPPGFLPGLAEHNDKMLGDEKSIVIESILPDSPTDDELRGKA